MTFAAPIPSHSHTLLLFPFQVTWISNIVISFPFIPKSLFPFPPIPIPIAVSEVLILQALLVINHISTKQCQLRHCTVSFCQVLCFSVLTLLVGRQVRPLAVTNVRVARTNWQANKLTRR